MVIYNKVIFREDSLMKCNSKSICSKIAVNLKRKGIIIDKQIAEKPAQIDIINCHVTYICITFFFKSVNMFYGISTSGKSIAI